MNEIDSPIMAELLALQSKVDEMLEGKAPLDEEIMQKFKFLKNYVFRKKGWDTEPPKDNPPGRVSLEII